MRSLVVCGWEKLQYSHWLVDGGLDATKFDSNWKTLTLSSVVVDILQNQV